MQDNITKILQKHCKNITKSKAEKNKKSRKKILFCCLLNVVVWQNVKKGIKIRNSVEKGNTKIFDL